MARIKNEARQSYKEPSTLNALLYAAVTAVLIFGPAAAPSVSLGEVVIGYIGVAMVVYVVMCILGVRQAFKRARTMGGGRTSTR